MKRSGRSVGAASRVIEIDEVLVARMRLRLEHRADLPEDLALDRLVLGGRLDDEIGLGQVLDVRRRGDAPQRGLAVLVLAACRG